MQNGIKHGYQEQNTKKVSLLQVKGIKSSVKGYKTWLSRIKY